MRSILLLCTIALAPALAQAAPVVDGTLDLVEYGAAVSVQTVETGFGDNESELNAAYATVDGGMLYLMFTGNLESIGNRLNVFIDSRPGGQNVIDGANNPTNDNWAAKHDGMTFDTGFAPDFLISLRNEADPLPGFDFDFSVIGGDAGDFDAATSIFGNALTGSGSVLGTFATFHVGFDDSNAAGILGGSGAANAAAALAVTTGIEIGIPLAALGNAGDTIRVSGMLNGKFHDYLSNQFLAGLAAPQINMGGDGAGGFTGFLGGIDLNEIPGDQYFAVAVPEPSTLALLGLGLLGLARGRRRA